MPLIFLTFALCAVAADARAPEWRRLPSLPDHEGFAAPFAGVSHGVLLVAGGANFPHKKPWEGGQKFWYDTVFVLEQPDGVWQPAGRLLRPLAYGVCVTHNEGVICVGGGDAERHYADVFRLEWQRGRLVATPLPPLPTPLANACGALVGDTLYVAGGQAQPDAPRVLKAAWVVDLAARVPAWKPLPPCPGAGRMLSVAASCDGAFWVIGGVDLVVTQGGSVERRYLNDAFRFDPGTGWRAIAPLPHALAAAPSPAAADAAGFVILGGDDGSQWLVAPDKHRGFSRQALRYDVRENQWAAVGELPAPRVTVPCVVWNQAWVVPNGEMRPGVRSPEVWAHILPKPE